jgi:hypothetical protein
MICPICSKKIVPDVEQKTIYSIWRIWRCSCGCKIEYDEAIVK